MLKWYEGCNKNFTINNNNQDRKRDSDNDRWGEGEKKTWEHTGYHMGEVDERNIISWQVIFKRLDYTYGGWEGWDGRKYAITRDCHLKVWGLPEVPFLM